GGIEPGVTRLVVQLAPGLGARIDDLADPVDLAQPEPARAGLRARHRTQLRKLPRHGLPGEGDGAAEQREQDAEPDVVARGAAPAAFRSEWRSGSRRDRVGAGTVAIQRRLAIERTAERKLGVEHGARAVEVARGTQRRTEQP